MNAKGKPIFSAIPLKLMGGNVKQYSSISTCLEDYYGDKAEKDTVKQRVSDLIRFLGNERGKNIKKLANLQKDLDEAQTPTSSGSGASCCSLPAHFEQRG